jgi:hypothetical protein
VKKPDFLRNKQSGIICHIVCRFRQTPTKNSANLFKQTQIEIPWKKKLKVIRVWVSYGIWNVFWKLEWMSVCMSSSSFSLAGLFSTAWNKIRKKSRCQLKLVYIWKEMSRLSFNLLFFSPWLLPIRLFFSVVVIWCISYCQKQFVI